MSALLLGLALAQGELDPAGLVSVGDGPQAITVVLQDLPPELRGLRVEHTGQGLSVAPGPLGPGVVGATLRARPARFAALRVIDDASAPPATLYEGLVPLPDQDRTLLAFRYAPRPGADGRPRPALLRQPVAPWTRVEVEPDNRPVYTVIYGWSALALAWLVALAALAVRGRRR